MQKKNSLWDLSHMVYKFTHEIQTLLTILNFRQIADGKLCFRFGQEKKDVLEDSVFNSPNQPPLKRPKLQPSPSPLHHQVKIYDYLAKIIQAKNVHFSR